MSSPSEKTRNSSHDDPSAAPTVFVAAILVVAMVLTVLGLQAYMGRAVSEEQEKKVVEVRAAALEAARAEQQARLSGYRWVAPDSGVVAVPIERAMELVTGELAARTPALPPVSGRPEPAPAPAAVGD